MNEFDISKGWAGEEPEESPLLDNLRTLSQKGPLPPGRHGSKNCVVCGSVSFFELIHLPNGFDEWRTFCTHCNFLERFSVPSVRGK